MTQKLCARARFVCFAAMLLALGTLPHPAYSQWSQGPACYAHLIRAKLISRGTGWAVVDEPSDHRTSNEDCTDEHLYWTDDDGQIWREITPPVMPARSIGTIFFLDRAHGWMLSLDDTDSENATPLFLLTTRDAGKHWQTIPLQRPADRWAVELWPTDIFFSDPNHGWITWRWAMMNSRVNALTTTSDGGRTWSTLPEPPGPAPLDFVSAHDGWMVGASAGQEGVPVNESNQLWATHDGGVHWSAISVPPPAGSQENAWFGALKFSNKNDGVMIAQAQVSDYVMRFYTCVTHDGGRSWKFSQFDAYEASASFVDTHVIWSVSHAPMKPPTIREDDREITPAIPDALSLQGLLSNIGFIDDSNAWATYLNDVRGPGIGPAVLELLSSTDGGKTFRTITPPAAQKYPVPPPELYSLNGSIVRFPPRPAFARRYPMMPPGARQIRFNSPAGGPMTITGKGFRPENTVWIGARTIQVASSDGANLQFLVPPDMTPGNYEVYVENSYGKTNEAEVLIRPPQPLKILSIENGESIHPGQEIEIVGSGVLLENEIWFGSQGVAAKLIVSGGAILQVVVPASIPPGSCEIYFTNASGKSDVVSVTVE